MRKLVVAEVEDGCNHSFEDIERLIVSCRFSNCSHRTEPDCAVLSALENGDLDRKRWKTYLEMQKEEMFAKERKMIIKKRMKKRCR